MVNRNLLRQFDLPEHELSHELAAAFGSPDVEWLPPEAQHYRDHKVVTGRVLAVTDDMVWVDVGYKSEGAVELREWYDDGLGRVVPPEPGAAVDVLLEALEDETGAVVLSYRKARWQKEWDRVLARHQEGDAVSGVVTRKIKGGLLVNIGVNVFLPASQVDTRRVPDLGTLIGQTVECKIVKIDGERRNIMVSRRTLIEERRAALRTQLLAEIEPGQVATRGASQAQGTGSGWIRRYA